MTTEMPATCLILTHTFLALELLNGNILNLRQYLPYLVDRVLARCDQPPSITLVWSFAVVANADTMPSLPSQ